jgi:hypothetical protein
MEKLIIYEQENKQLWVVIPAPECDLTLEEIAKKDVPSGVPYKFIDRADLPADVDFRDAWEADFSDPDGYGIGHDAWFAEQAAKEEV